MGVGHGSCTCDGAAFEYVVNLEFELRAHKVRGKAEIIFVTNEYELGDFGDLRGRKPSSADSPVSTKRLGT